MNINLELTKDKESSEFSTFVREARSSEKKKVFRRILNDSIDAQVRLIKDAESTTKDKVWPDYVQIRLHMTSEEINERRANDCNRSATQMGREREKTKRLFDALHAAPWAGTTRRVSPNSKDAAYWERRVDMAREIAERKTERKQRRYWNKMTKRYQEKAND